MSLAPSTDIILEVSSAADPARAAAIAEKLGALASKGADTPQDFAAALQSVSRPPPVQPAPVARAANAETKLEAVFLSQFITEMLPKDAQSVYGQGYAGDMWRSMLAERVADQMAASGRIGIASRLFAHRPLESHAPDLKPESGRGLVDAQPRPSGVTALLGPDEAALEPGGGARARKPML